MLKARSADRSCNVIPGSRNSGKSTLVSRFRTMTGEAQPSSSTSTGKGRDDGEKPLDLGMSYEVLDVREEGDEGGTCRISFSLRAESRRAATDPTRLVCRHRGSTRLLPRPRSVVALSSSSLARPLPLEPPRLARNPRARLGEAMEFRDGAGKLAVAAGRTAEEGKTRRQGERGVRGSRGTRTPCVHFITALPQARLIRLSLSESVHPLVPGTDSEWYRCVDFRRRTSRRLASAAGDTARQSRNRSYHRMHEGARASVRCCPRNWLTVVHISQADQMNMLERDREFTEEQFDYIQQLLRTIALRCGCCSDPTYGELH